MRVVGIHMASLEVTQEYPKKLQQKGDNDYVTLPEPQRALTPYRKRRKDTVDCTRFARNLARREGGRGMKYASGK